MTDATPTSAPTGTASAPAHRRTSGFWRRALPAAVAAFLVAELVVRAVSSRLPEPLEWYHPVAQVKVAQMDARQHAGAATEVAFVGTSQTAEGVDPVRFAERASGHPATYNAAVLAGYPAVSARFVPEEVLPRLDPEVVVFGVSPFDLTPGEEAPYDEAKATSPSWLAALDRRLSAALALVHYRTVLRDPAQWPSIVAGSPGEVENIRTFAVGEDGRWQLYTGAGCGANPPSPPVSDEPIALQVDPARVDAVRSTLQAVRRSGATPMLAIVPMPPCNLDGGRARAAYDEGRRLLGELAAEAGAPVLDVTGEMADDRWYQDSGHLGADGADRYTDLLAAAYDRARTGDS